MVGTDAEKLTFHGGANEFNQEVSELYDQLRGKVHTTNLSHSLVKTQDHLNGTPLRQQGGVYWIPSKSESTWRAVSDYIEGEQKGNIIYIIRHTFDSESVRAVQEAISANLMKEVNDIYEDITSGEEKTEAEIESRHKKISVLKEKADGVFKATGVTVESAQESIAKLSQAAASVIWVE
jgi:hypothetical protein